MEGTVTNEQKLVGTLSSNGSMVGGVGTVFAKDGKSAYEVALDNGFKGTEAEWLESLKGERGIQGMQGNPFTYEDFTQEQLDSLKGEPGYTPVKGVDYFDGKDGQPGKDGKDGIMTFEELTDAQKESLRGERGEKGDKGDPFTYGDFTPAQLEALKGEPGKDGTMSFEDLTAEQKESLRGEKGERGEKGDAFTYEDFTNEQLASLKGEPGSSGVYVGSGDMPADCNVQIDPSGDSTPIEELARLLGIRPAKIASVTLLASAWAGADSLYSQIVSIDGVTEYSKVDLLPSVEQLAIFYNKDVTFVTENEDGVVTVFAIGDKPTQDYTVQAQIMEVEV